MKKFILSGLTALAVISGANASDGGLYGNYAETVRPVTRQVAMNPQLGNYRYVATPRVARRATISTTPCAQPYTVKIGAEIIEHYQTYRPVTTYRPAETYSTRRVVRNGGCNTCGY